MDPYVNHELKGKMLINNLHDLFPEFKKSREWLEDCDQDLPYMVYGSFVDFVSRIMKSIEKPENDPFVKKAYQYFDELVSSDDEYVSTLGVTQVVEQLSQQMETLRLMKKFFSDKSLVWVDKSLKYTGVARSLIEIPD